MGKSEYDRFKQRLFDKRKNKLSGLCKRQLLSQDLSKLVGVTRGSRTEIMSRLHEYVRKNGLLDPKDKRFFFPDENMQPIFGSDRMRTFAMAKHLNKHLTPLPRVS